MSRSTGSYRIVSTLGEEVRAFLPFPLPPSNPPLRIDAKTTELLSDAERELSRLALACSMVPSIDWFLYSFVRKEAVITSEIEGTRATLGDLLSFETTGDSSRMDDVLEVCNYVDALTQLRDQLSDERGLPLSIPLLCKGHKILMHGTRGRTKLPGEIRRSQVWIGGTRPSTAQFVPPPHEEIPDALGALERWWHTDSSLPPLVRVGLAHVQFETIHPFLDGNGRIGRLLVALLLEHWNLLDQPLLYISVAFRARQAEYYTRLDAVRTSGDWEGWILFFLSCIQEAASHGTHLAVKLHELVTRDRRRTLDYDSSTLAAVQLLELLPTQPMITVKAVSESLGLTAPPSRKAIQILENLGILREISGMVRSRVYAYQEYVDTLAT